MDLHSSLQPQHSHIIKEFVLESPKCEDVAFKAGGYLFGLWEYQLVACVAVGAAIIIIPGLFHRVKRT